MVDEKKDSNTAVEIDLNLAKHGTSVILRAL